MEDDDPDVAEWDLDERDAFMAAHAGDDEEPEVEVVLGADE